MMSFLNYKQFDSFHSIRSPPIIIFSTIMIVYTLEVIEEYAAKVR